MENPTRNQFAHPSRSRASLDALDTTNVPDDVSDGRAGDITASHDTMVDDASRHAWASPASDLAAKRLANRQRLLDDLAASFEPRSAPLPEALPTELVRPPHESAEPHGFILDHLLALALALSLVVSLVTALGTLSVTGDLSGTGNDQATQAVPAIDGAATLTTITGHLPVGDKQRLSAQNSRPNVTPALATERAIEFARWWEARFLDVPITEGAQLYDASPGPQDGTPQR